LGSGGGTDDEKRIIKKGSKETESYPKGGSNSARKSTGTKKREVCAGKNPPGRKVEGGEGEDQRKINKTKGSLLKKKKKKTKQPTKKNRQKQNHNGTLRRGRGGETIPVKGRAKTNLEENPKKKGTKG